MRSFFWRMVFCTVPLLVAAVVVGLAFRNYYAGRGGFRLGVDLVGGTILIYEVDVSRLPDGQLPPDWDPRELARRLKARVDPNDLYNVTIRAVSNTRFEIILPTGGQHQIEAEERAWKDLLRKVEEKYPVRAYKVPPGHVTELVAAINAQYPPDPDEPKTDVARIRSFIEENYKAPRDAKAWDALLEKSDAEYPPQGYVLGRGKVTELAGEVAQQHPEAAAKDVNEVLQLSQAEGGKGPRGGANLTREQVQEAKELIAQAGSLEFRILASREHDKEGIDAAIEYFKGAAKDEKRKAKLAELAYAGKPPPPPVGPDGVTTFAVTRPDGRYGYSWVELSPTFRQEHGLSNPRDERGNLIDPRTDPRYRGAPEFEAWVRAAEARDRGEVTFLLGKRTQNGRFVGWDEWSVPLYSREVPPGRRLSEEDKDKRYEYFVLCRDAESPAKRITGDYVAGAAPGDSGNVNFRMKPAGADLFWEFTSQNKDQLMAIVLDGQVQSAATIISAIRDHGQITGNFTAEKVMQLVRVLRSGPLQASLKQEPVSESTMGATLGADTIRWGTASVLIAFGFVLGFMLVYYRFAGLVACIALMANLLLTVAFMVLINATFTLPGLAGLVLMLGMAVDANVLIYERLREERERGANLALAIRNGYEHALPTIIDTHLSSIFTAVVLYMFGNDQLKGFGVSLTVGLIISLFTSLYMTRLMFDYWLARGWLHKLSMMRLFRRPNFDFMSIRYYWFAGTITLTVLGAWLFIARMPDPADPAKKSLLNIDFVGGTAYGGELNQMVEVDQLRDLLHKTELPDLSVEQIFISSGAYSEGTRSKLFTLRTSEKDVNKVQDAINEILGPRARTDLNPTDIRLKTIYLASFEPLPGGREMALSFTADPDGRHPDFASRAQVSMLLANQLRKQGLESEAQSFTLEGLGREEEGHFQWMRLTLLEPPKDPAKLTAALAATQGEFRDRPQPVRLENFDSQLAAETQLSALYAILASWAAILLYLWFRFGSWTFGAAAVLCLIHDLFFTLGGIALCHYLADVPFFRALGIRDFKMDLASVAALLTLVGYSVNDTIVVFDRIREVRGKNPALTPQMINDSVNQTLSRTVLASLTVWLVVIVLYCFGGEGVHLFAFVMIIGVIVGTYSSIYIASPLLLIFGEGRTATPARPQPQPVPTA
jgi:SecD/SecF fusion protein